MTEDDDPGVGARPLALAARGLRTRGLLFLARYVAPGLAAIALVLVLAGERSGLDADLHVIVAHSARPGSRLPLRALLYTQLRATEGPVLRSQPVDVALQRPDGSVLARTRLLPARAHTRDLEGELTLPADGGELQLRAQTEVGGEPVRAQTALQIADDVEPVLPQGRLLRALQQFSEGAVVGEPGETPPAALRVRIRGGTCVPEQPCRALVHIGSPAATLRVEANSALTPSPAAAKASAATSGVVELSFVTHGPEAELWLIAEREGRRVARRAVRLAVAMAALSLETERLLLEPGASPRLRAPAADEGCIVDAFRAGAWAHTGSLAHCDAFSALPFAAAAPGILRLQVRQDAFSAQTAGVAIVYLRAPAESPEQVTHTLALAAARVDPSDTLSASLLSDPAADADPAALAYLAALLEEGVIEAPAAINGYADSVARVRERQGWLRSMALVALALGASALALSIGRRGLDAGARASELLLRESRDPGLGRRTRLRSLALVVASVLSLMLVFAVIGLYVLARGAN